MLHKKYRKYLSLKHVFLDRKTKIMDVNLFCKAENIHAFRVFKFLFRCAYRHNIHNKKHSENSENAGTSTSVTFDLEL